MLIKEQNCWYFEDTINPTKGRLIREVMDLYTDQQFIKIHLKNFLKLNIKRRDLNSRLFFVACEPEPGEKHDYVVFNVNLGDLESYPKSVGYNENHLRHVKLELEYLDPKPGFEKKPFKLGLKNPTGYMSTSRVDGPNQHEYSITLPKGMKLEKNESSPALYYDVGGNTGKLELNIQYVERFEGNQINHLLIDEDDYEDKYGIIRDPKVEFYLHYSVSNKLKYIVFFPIFALFMLSFVLILFLPLLKSFLGSTLPLNFTLVDFFNILIPQTIVLFPYTYYYVDSRRRNFEVPFNRITEYSILAALSILLINIILLSSNYLRPFDILQFIVNNVL